MIYYIQAYHEDDTPCLGNGDFQGILNAKDYKRTSHYKNMLRHSTRSDIKVSYYLVRRGYDGPIEERIDTNSYRNLCKST
jgi:hypothetical protein